MKWFIRTTEEERVWERNHILNQLDRYLATDVLDKIANDNGYRAKIDLIEGQLGKISGWILDLGSNTAGECEYLVTRGYSIIATEINEQALLISQKRCRHFGRSAPAYVACDAQKLPFADGSVACAVFNESLHHIPDPGASLREVQRVLGPGGRVIMYEPYSYDPWRRISEVRDYFRGTVETSFSVGQLRKLLEDAGLAVGHLSRPALPPSRWKLDALPLYRRALRTGYYRLRAALPGMLGMILCEARKDGNPSAVTRDTKLDDFLICPRTRVPLRKTSRGYLSTVDDTLIGYPVLEGIPVLIATDAFEVSRDEWRDAMNESRPA